jgi:hypothetical protein
MGDPVLFPDAHRLVGTLARGRFDGMSLGRVRILRLCFQRSSDRSAVATRGRIPAAFP